MIVLADRYTPSPDTYPPLADTYPPPAYTHPPPPDRHPPGADTGKRPAFAALLSPSIPPQSRRHHAQQQ
ncbi:MAG: hypothetical protein LBO00_08255 [Zoogloeaceae bacterium]|nr:hypothetical protein [Zoogloeaceae bacterium]